MKNKNTLPIVCIGIVAIAGALYFHLHPPKITHTDASYEYGTADEDAPDALTQWHIDGLTAVREGCTNYYLTGTLEPNPASTTDLLPIESYTCGGFSDVKKMMLTSGKRAYFIAIDTSTDCDGSECWYYAFLEEKPGLVRPMVGFSGYIMNPDTGEFEQLESTQDQLFGSLSFDPRNNLVKTYGRTLCGVENVYQIDDSFPPPVHLIESYGGSCGNTGSTTLFH